MENYQSFSYRLLYEMEPTFLSSLHLNYDNSDKADWENAKTSNNASVMDRLLKLLKY